MLFDLRGKRKRFIQVVYAILAALFLISFVGFGIGSDAAGGLFDAIGVGSGQGGGTSSNPQFEQQIEDAEERLEADPENRNALLEIAQVRVQAGQQELDQDDQGNPVMTDDAREEFEAATDAWQRYLELKPKRPDSSAANLLTVAYQSLIGEQLSGQSGVDPQRLQANLDGSVETAKVVADENPDAGLLNLAFSAYLAGDERLGDRTTEKALKRTQQNQRGAVRQQLEQAKQQGKQIQRAIRQSAPGEEELVDPLGGAGGAAPAPGAGGGG